MQSTKEKRGYTGLANLGNTCFLNACLQVMSHTYELAKLLDSQKCKKLIKPDSPDSTILNEWSDLRKIMWSNNGVVSPNKFVHTVQQISRLKNKDIFTGFAQNDMSEFLLFFMDCLHNSISRPIHMKINGTIENATDQIAVKSYEMLKTVYEREYSELMDMMYGIYVTNIRHITEDKIHSIHPEHFSILDLQLFNEHTAFTTIEECFDHFTIEEILQGDNAWFNDATQTKETVKKNVSFWSLPQILVITLKRFLPDGQHKINNLVQFPIENLDLNKYIIGYNKSSYLYDLYGVCNHMGGVHGGHYTAFVKNQDNVWIHYNDTSVEIVNDPLQIITPMAYCLFYRKKNKVL